jgi:HEAT repeat protein
MIERIEEALMLMASDPSLHVRGAVSAAMDRVLAKRLMGQFRALLRDGTLEEKIHVVHAAGEMAGSEGIMLLIEALSDKTDEVRGAAIRALSSYLTPNVLKALWEMLPRETGVVLGNLIEVLGSSGRKELRPHIEKYLAHPNVEVRAKAIIAVSRLIDGTGWEKIMALRGDPDELVRAAVAEGLGNWTFAKP